MPQASPSRGTRPTAGVAMCVYNGERYLREQLASIAGQTELPRRMVVVDDGSDDGSWELLQQWAPQAPFPVHLHRNAARLGVVKNFEKAASLLLDEVDVVFFSDQDDAWLPGKLAAFIDAFADDPRLGLVHCDAELVDAAGAPLGRTLLQALLLKDRERSDIATGRPFRSYAARNLVTGAACACRSTVLARALPFPQDWIHDDWIAATAVLVSRVKLLEQPWMRYRLHGQNTVGLPVPNLAWRLRKVVSLVFDDHGPAWARRLARVERMRAHALALGAPREILEALERAIAHARHRSSLPRGFFRRAAAVAAQCRAGSYREWSSGGISVVRDLLIAR